MSVAAGPDRWATFDCYGTLIDWNGGMRRELVRVFGEENADDRLARYHELEPELQRDGTRTYREVMAEAMHRLGAPVGEEETLAGSLPSWTPFPEVPASLAELRGRGWRLAILSNSDPDLIAASKQHLVVPFDLTIVASEIGSYKPAHGHWTVFSERTHADPERHVHVAASSFHDIGPANELGMESVWINRLGEHPANVPTRELPDLAGLAGVLDELVPPG
jgi:2-haloacid dehalogenase